MALVVTKLQADLIAAAQTQPDDAAGKAVWAAIAQAIDAYIKTATVSVTVTGAAAGVMSGPSTAAVTGTGTGTLA